MTINIIELVKIFYLLEFMRGMMYQGKMNFLHSTERFLEDFNAFYNRYAKTFASMLYDYIIWASALEMTNAPTECNIAPLYLCRHYIFELDVILSRKIIETLHVPSYIEMAKRVYDAPWSYAYGGQKWKKAVDYLELKGKVTDTIFIDSVIDLQHNTGSLFSKANPYFRPVQRNGMLQRYLSNKTQLEQDRILFSFLLAMASNSMNTEIYNLVFRFIQLYSGRYWKEALFYDEYGTYRDHMLIWQNSTPNRQSDRCMQKFFEYEPVVYSDFKEDHQVDDAGLVQAKYMARTGKLV